MTFGARLHATNKIIYRSPRGSGDEALTQYATDDMGTKDSQ